MSDSSSSSSSAPYRWIPDDHGEDTIVSSFRGFTADHRSTGHAHDRSTDRDDHDRDDQDHGGSLELASETFVKEIQRDREICSSCFRHTHDTIIPYSPRPSVRRGLVRYYKGRDDTTSYVSSAADVTRNPPRACDCGSIGPSRQRPLPKRVALAAAWNLSRTLAKKDIEHNPLLLVAIVTRRKSTPEHASRDDRNFATATSRSLAATGESFVDELGLGASTTPALPKPKPTSETGGPLLHRRATLVEEGER
jgi:hypothetical protein